MYWTAFLDAFLVARQLPRKLVDDRSWKGNDVITQTHHRLPYGYDRLIYIWLATCAAQTDTVECRLADICQQMGLRWTPAQVADSLHRIDSATTRLTKDTGSSSTDWSTYTTFETLRVSHRRQHVSLRFGSLFHIASPIPANGNVIRDLARTRSLRILDQYLWQITAAHRHHPSPLVTIPIATVQVELACPLDRKSAFHVRERQKQIQKIWPQCPHEITKEGFVLRPRR